MSYEYSKIDTVWKRDERGVIVVGDFANDEFAYLANNDWEWTEKVDGTNIRVMWNPETQTVTFGGKEDTSQLYAPLVKRLQELFMSKRSLDIFAEHFDSPTIIYGEGYGARIQKGGGNYSQTPEFVVFDVLCSGWWLKPDNVKEVADYFDVDTVPVVGHGTLTAACNAVANGFLSWWGDFDAEGLVMRPEVQLFNRKSERIIAKIKHRDYVKFARTVGSEFIES